VTELGRKVGRASVTRAATPI